MRPGSAAPGPSSRLGARPVRDGLPSPQPGGRGGDTLARYVVEAKDGIHRVRYGQVSAADRHARGVTAENTERRLEAGARAYVNHPRGVSLAGGVFEVSSIYVWSEDDFGREVLAHLRRYARPELFGRLAPIDEVDGHACDWSLNDATGP